MKPWQYCCSSGWCWKLFYLKPLIYLGTKSSSLLLSVQHVWRANTATQTWIFPKAQSICCLHVCTDMDLDWLSECFLSNSPFLLSLQPLHTCQALSLERSNTVVKKSNAIILSIFLLKFFFQLQLISVWLAWPFTLQGSSLAKGINVVTACMCAQACADVCNHWLCWVMFSMDKFWLQIFLHAFSCAQIYHWCLKSFDECEITRKVLVPFFLFLSPTRAN